MGPPCMAPLGFPKESYELSSGPRASTSLVARSGALAFIGLAPREPGGQRSSGRGTWAVKGLLPLMGYNNLYIYMYVDTWTLHNYDSSGFGACGHARFLSSAVGSCPGVHVW